MRRRLAYNLVRLAARMIIVQPIGILGTFIHLAHRGQRPGWVHLAAIALCLGLLAGIGLLLA